ncbi:MAG: hypothetical protein HFJ53_04655 [Clostridia bacterium]|nr:hypothetical protein [Clostridia bacterium]
MKKNNSEIKWFFTVFIATFLLSLLFSYISSTAINDIPVMLAILILVLVIGIGILFDIIGVAVTIAEEEEFHARASKKIPGSKTAINLIRNSAKVANICADVIGDICGVLSGAISAMVSLKIMQKYGLSFDIQFFVSALVAALTVGGKALGKSFAKNKNGKIVAIVSKILNIFYIKK